MLTGRRPFHGESQLSTMAAILRDRPQPLTATGRMFRAKSAASSNDVWRRIGNRAIHPRSNCATILPPFRPASPLHQQVSELCFAARVCRCSGSADLLTIAGAIAWVAWRSSRARWARNEVLPAAHRLAQQLQMHGAGVCSARPSATFPTIRSSSSCAERLHPWFSIHSIPRRRGLLEGLRRSWRRLGVRRPYAARSHTCSGWLSSLEIVKPGFETLELANLRSSDISFASNPMAPRLRECVRVPAGNYELAGSQALRLPEYWIDKYRSH